MALIRCPNCDTLHDLDGALFAGGSRKVRCASCREIWTAQDPESPGASAGFAIPALDSLRQDRPAPATGPAATLPTAEPDPAAEPLAEAADISAEELEALFADEAKPETAAGQEKPGPETAAEDKPADSPEFDPASLAREQDAAMAAEVEDIETARARRRAERLKRTDAHHRPAPTRSARPLAAMVMAAGIGTLATLVALRHETVRLVPETAGIFEAFGLGSGLRSLDIRDVQSRLVTEDARETLEITGTIVNPTKSAIKIPVLRLSIRNGGGQEIYVWTATADQSELPPGESTTFRRRLASPPAESHAVMVRFVAKDDIVAAIR